MTRKRNGAPGEGAAAEQHRRLESTNAGGERHRLTPLQAVLGEIFDALDLIGKLSGRERAVALDIARRRLRRMLRRHRGLLEEWQLAPADEPASISIEFTRGFARIRNRGSATDLQELKRWLVANDAAFADFAECIRVVRGER